ncbi:hypothetical protein DFH09DRAFT_1104950 [Mycena vulgaris]|nr:hypothetical protein DFH09DRAFT_1104950 [Mycena vulgaris]
MQFIFPFLGEIVTFAVLVILILMWAPSASEHAVLQDEIAYQEGEIVRLEGLVKERRCNASLKEQIHRLTAKIEYLEAELQDAQGTAEADIDSLVEEHNIRIQELTARYNTECEEREVAASMNWAVEREVEELQQMIQELRKCTQNAFQQSSICERRQAAVITALQGHIKTAARLGAEQEANIRDLVEQVAAKENEKEEVAVLAEEIAMQSEAACEAQRKVHRRYIKDIKKKWAVAWNWASDERRELRARLEDLKEVDRRDNPFISTPNPLVDREDDENADEGMTDMLICTEDSLNSNPLVEEASLKSQPPKSTSLHWVPSPSKTLAGRRVVRKMALSANPLDSPFVFATNSVRFAPADVKYEKDRSAKRVKVDRARGVES